MSELLIFIIVFLVVVYLIFKFIKKLVFAIITFILLIVLIFAGVFALIYADLNNLASQNNLTFHVIHGDPIAVERGISLTIVNKSVDNDSLQSFKETKVEEVSFENAENEFYVFVSEEFYDSLLENEEEYYLIGTENLEISGQEIETVLTQEEVQTIIESNDPVEEYVNIIFEKNEDLPEFAKPIAENEIEEKLEELNLEMDEALFVSSVIIVVQEDQTSILDFVEAYKEDELIVEPERLSFKLVKWLPTGIVDFLFPDFSKENQE